MIKRQYYCHNKAFKNTKLKKKNFLYKSNDSKQRLVLDIMDSSFWIFKFKTLEHNVYLRQFFSKT